VTVSSWVTRGYRPSFLTKPPLSVKVRPFSLPRNREKKKLLLGEIVALVQKRALVRVPLRSLREPAFYSLLFLVPKTSGGFRPVVDVSRLNDFIDCPHFKMETVDSIVRAMRPGDWSFSIDLSDAYLHVPLHPHFRRFLRVALSPTKVYAFHVLPFGLNTAPLVFTRLATTVAAALRRKGVRMHVYLDDWLFLDQSRTALESSRSWILDFIRDLGFMINVKKSRLEVSQHFEHLGLFFDTALQTVRPADHLVAKVIRQVSALGPSTQLTTPRVLSRTIGLLNSVAGFVELGRLNLRPVQFWLASHWSQKDADWDVSIRSDPELVQALSPWLNQSWLLAGIPLVTPTPTLTLFTDASLSGWGATLGDLHAKGSWSREEALRHINVLELLAVQRAIEVFRNTLRSHCVLLLSDNTACVAYLRRQGGTKSTDMCALTWDILHRLLRLQVKLLVRHIPSSRNVLADALSRRKPLLTEWSLNPSVFRCLLRLVPRLSVDLFATRLNHQLSQFVSPCPDQRALAVDALSIPWDFQGVPYAFPPPKILPLVLRKIREEEIPLVLVVAPFWPRQPWYPDLVELSVAHAFSLPQIPSLLQQVGWVHPNPGLYALHAWMLSGMPSPAKAIQSPSLRRWLAQAGIALTPSTMASGGVMQLGATHRGPILSIPMDRD
jgi:hypothetical protein